jgi:uncharacterized repeat protein (TIGR03803 family)
MSKPSLRRIFFLCVVCAAGAIDSPAQTFTTLASFDGADGAYASFGSLVQGFDGNFYGTTYGGGANQAGAVFKVTPSGALTTLYSFCAQAACTDGSSPEAGLVLATNGNFYGSTTAGGASGDGTVFEITPAGTLTTLHSFDGTDGATPFDAPVQATDGNFYATTPGGGAYGQGTVFKMTPSGTLTTLYSFCAQAGCPDGSDPEGGLIQGTDGNFYGTTNSGGTSSGCGSDGCGTVFKITPAGTLTTLHSFQDSDGDNPYDALVQATDGNFYGTTHNDGIDGDGTVFQITPGGTLTTLHQFDGTDGENPLGGLLQATDRNLYGTTFYGGAVGDGTVFRISTSGTLTTLYNVWGINAAGQVFRYDSQLQSWDSVPGILTSLAVAFDGTVWGVNSAQQVWRYNVQTQGWDSIAGQMSQISVGADAVVWGVNANASGQSYQYW